MSIIVEDGTGLTTAETYISVADADAYFAARSITNWASATTAAKEAALRASAQYIDTKWRFKGARASSAQALEWPRTGCVDWSSYEVAGLPLKVAQACAELAFRALTVSLYSDLARGGQIKSESVGPISTTYADGAPPDTTYMVAERLLIQYIRDPNPQAAPYYGGATDGYFSLGMHDSPPANVDNLAG